MSILLVCFITKIVENIRNYNISPLAVRNIVSQETLCSSDVQIKVPPVIEQGKDVVFQCIYNLEEGKLYSLKWYRRQQEFFRYNPNDVEVIKQFKIPGLNVDESLSNSTHLFLRNISTEVSGPFSCEVTEDQPSFYTDMKTANVTVVELPKEGPIITGLEHKYKSGDILKAYCTSKDSVPAANLTWFVNGYPWDEPRVKRHKPRYSKDGKYFTAHTSIRIVIREDLFEAGHLKIKCSANIYDVYLRTTEKSVRYSKKKHAHNKITNDFYVSTTTTTTEESATLWFFIPSGQDRSTALLGFIGICQLITFYIIMILLS